MGMMTSSSSRSVVLGGGREYRRTVWGVLSVAGFFALARLLGLSLVTAGWWSRMVLAAMFLFMLHSLLRRDNVTIDPATRRWKTSRGLWPALDIVEGDFSQIRSVNLDYVQGGESSSWRVSVERTDGTEAVKIRYSVEAEARTAWADAVKAIGCDAWDRTGDHPLLRPKETSPAAPEHPRPGFDRPLDPPKGVEVTGLPGSMRILLPPQGRRVIVALFALVFELLTVNSLLGRPPWKILGLSPEVSFAVVLAAILFVPIAIGVSQDWVHEDGESITVGVRSLGIPWFSTRFLKSEVVEVATVARPGKTLLGSGGPQLLVRSREKVARIGGLGATTVWWLESAIRGMLPGSKMLPGSGL
jgi:hypothetical protein